MTTVSSPASSTPGRSSFFQQGANAFKRARNHRKRGLERRELERRVDKVQMVTREKDEMIADVRRAFVFVKRRWEA